MYKRVLVLAIAVAVIGAAVWMTMDRNAEASSTRSVNLAYDSGLGRVVGSFEGIQGDIYTEDECTRTAQNHPCWGDGADRIQGRDGSGWYDASSDASGTQYTYTVRFYDSSQTLLATIAQSVTKP